MRPSFKKILLSLVAISMLAACATVREEVSTEGTQTGIASWYGKDFHGKPTASGEIYDMYAMTAAHKTLPLGSIVHVKNLENGRDARVVVNDRGPFVMGRIIDLSYSAAKDIGIAEVGTAKVSIRVLGRDSRYIKYVKVDDSGKGGNYVVQLGAFVERQNAERLKTALGWKHSGAYIMKASVSGKTFYRVRIGEFKTKDKARALAEALAEEGYPVVLMRD